MTTVAMSSRWQPSSSSLVVVATLSTQVGGCRVIITGGGVVGVAGGDDHRC